MSDTYCDTLKSRRIVYDGMEVEVFIVHLILSPEAK